MTQTIYPADAHASIPWPENEAGQRAAAWLLPLLREGVSPFIRNVDTELSVLVSGDAVLPLSTTEPRHHNSYVCSPRTHYLTYGREELDKLDSRLQRWLFRGAVDLMDLGFRFGGFDRVVYVNNWLLSTNLYPQLDPTDLEAVHAALLERFPRHPLVFRSVDERANPAIYAGLRALGYRPVFSRFVWYQDPASREVQRRKNYRLDRSALRRSGYEVVPGDALEDADYARVEHLYNQLYLDKYSRFNPQFTARFISTLARAGLLELRLLRKDGRFDGVFGFYSRRGIGTAPLFGYDTSLPQKQGLYRILSHVWSELARERGLLINASAGVGAFKKSRGAIPALESNMVYAAHTPGPRRCWGLLGALLDRVAVPIILDKEL